jgi:hypothetical protein
VDGVDRPFHCSLSNLAALLWQQLFFYRDL